MQAGNLVRCIRGYKSGPKEGEIYTIGSVEGPLLHLLELPSSEWFANRFELADQFTVCDKTDPSIPLPAMTLNDYQDLASATDNNHPLAYYILEICNEAGELASPLKKHIFRDKPLDKEAVLLEMGDVLWPLSQLAKHLGFTLEDVAAANIKKLRARHG